MITVNYCDFNTNAPDYQTFYRPNGTIDYLFLLILAPMHFYFQNHEVIAKPGACILYTPGHPQHYGAVKEFYNSFIHFISDNNYLLNYSFPINELFYPANTHEIDSLLQKIHTEFLTKTRNYLLQIDAYMTQLHVNLDRSYISSTVQPNINATLFSEFQSLRLKMFSQCGEDWSIERMCQIVNLEKSQFYAYYKMFYHTAPKAELINVRIEKAKSLLTNETIKINQVAQACGFPNIYHFTRYFKKICKCTPSEFANRITVNNCKTKS